MILFLVKVSLVGDGALRTFGLQKTQIKDASSTMVAVMAGA